MKPTNKRWRKRQSSSLEIVEEILARRPAIDERTVRRLVDEALGVDRVKAQAAMDRLNWHESTGGAISEITDDQGKTVAYGRTPMGQAAYDLLCSSMSGAEVVRRHPQMSREFVLQMRQKYRKLRAKS